MTSTRAVKTILARVAALWLAASSALAADKPTRIRRIGVLVPGNADMPASLRISQQIMKRLAERGYVDGKNIVFETGITVPQSVLLRADRVIE